ncbi:MAG: SpoIIE family protein phosphatase, partial [Monoglobaceae bacterium]
FDRELAVRLVNSIMVMKWANEAFATVDICVIDLFGGEAEFIKNGAEPSYIKRGGTIETVKGASLPVGVVRDVEIETFAHKLNIGDTVVMLSDGMRKKDGSEEWIKTMIAEADENMPAQELADRIMDMSKILHGNEIADDMTVMVMKLCRGR